MFTLFDTPFDSPVLIGLAIAYALFSSITTLDIRLIQAVKQGTLPPNEPMLPKWVAIIHWLEWLILIAMCLLNWKFGLIAYATRFVLRVLPVLEMIGNMLMAPFRNTNH